MEPFRLLVSFEEALETLMRHCRPVDGSESVDISSACGRVVSTDVVAQQDVPPFDRAAMDGYAVVASDTFPATQQPVVLEVTGRLHAGEAPSTEVTPGTCVQVATGAPLPPGADAVVMVEFTEEQDGKVSVTRPVYPGANVSRAGEDIDRGQVVLRSGTYLTPARVGVLAALGMTSVTVFRRPEVAVVPTGREVVPPGRPLRPGQVFDVNSFTLEAVLRSNGAVVRRLPVVTDEYGALRSAVESAAQSCDMVVLSGGSSVGEKDLLVGVIEELGTVHFHGVQVKPGKPTLFGTVGDTPVLGMPGYPTSCLSNAYMFLLPAVRKMARLPPRHEHRIVVPLAKRYVSSSGRKQFLTVRVSDGHAYPAYKHSGAITSMSDADGYVVLPVNLDVIEEGEEVEVVMFDQ